MELRYKREAVVGLMLVLGTVAFIVLMMWLRGKSFRSGDIVRISFDDVAGLKEGDPVRTSGVTVGAVRSIRLVSPGNVNVEFDVQKGPPPREDASARILSADLFGARYIEYSPGTANKPLPAGHQLKGVRVQDMSEMAAALGDRGKALIDSLTGTSSGLTRDLHTTLVNVNRLLATLDRSASTSTDRLALSLDELRRTLQRVDMLLAENGPVATEALRSVRSTAQRTDSLALALSHTGAQLDTVLFKINHGNGPAAALVNDTSIVRQLMETNTALRELLVDFKANPSRYIRLRL